MCHLFFRSLKEHLREGFISKKLINFESKIDELEKFNHKPNYIMNEIYFKIYDLHKRNKFDSNTLIILDNQLKKFADVLGGCERIRNTPIPFSYNMFLKKFIFIYTLTLPFGFVTELGYWAIPISTFILYVLSSLELLAEEIEDPFGKDANDLPLEKMCENIKNNTKEILLKTN